MHYTVQPGDYAPFHAGYVELVKDQDIVDYIRRQGEIVATFLDRLTEEQGNFAYAPGKWTVKEVIQHVIDAERIFAFRMLAMSRGEQQPIPGFDQDAYAAAVDVTGRTVKDLREEFISVRKATYTLLQSLHKEALERRGTVSSHPLAAGAVPYILAGHLEHHLRCLRDLYGLH
jgi:uncharacterized damage-inducible protein DinB